jgi:sulfate adenylyltransferase large subunit
MGKGMKERLKFVIVGHVDHGKSTLIGRLLFDTDSLPEGKMEEIKSICDQLGKDLEFGFLMDHIQEEREQGITIDTTQTFFNTEKREYVIIDAPGHREFVKNMITGASQAEAAILIVDVKEGIEEQTRRHAYILSMLGLGQVIVVMNKMDLVGYGKDRFDQVKHDLLSFLSPIGINPSMIIPISAREGDNIAKKSKKMEWYPGQTVLQALDTFKPGKSTASKPLRLPVQDIYKFNENRIIAGRVESGLLRVEDEVAVLPGSEVTKIKTIEQYPGQVEEAGAGKSIGITTADKIFVDRGNVIVHKSDPFKVTDEIKAHVFWMDRIPLEKGERITFKCATQEVKCEIAKIEKVLDSSTLEIRGEDASRVENTEVADIIIKTARPVVVENFNDVQELGRFVLERNDTCAGGIITEV